MDQSRRDSPHSVTTYAVNGRGEVDGQELGSLGRDLAWVPDRRRDIALTELAVGKVVHRADLTVRTLDGAGVADIPVAVSYTHLTLPTTPNV